MLNTVVVLSFEVVQFRLATLEGLRSLKTILKFAVKVFPKYVSQYTGKRIKNFLCNILQYVYCISVSFSTQSQVL